MRRRTFIAALGGAAAWPLVVRGQQPDPVRHIGVLMAYAESVPEAQAWSRRSARDSRNLGGRRAATSEIDIRWATGDREAIQRFAKELVALQPDLPIVSSTTPPLQRCCNKRAP